MKRYRSLFYATAFIASAIISCKSHGDKDVNEPNPVAAFDVAAEIPKDSVRTLTNNSTNADSYTWSVSPSTGVVITDPSAKNVVLKFTAEGQYTIKLEAKKSGKPTSTLEKTVNVTADPIANFTYQFADINVAPVKVKLDGTTSANATTYQWTMVNGGPNIVHPTNAIPDSVTFLAAGTYTVRLTVTKGAKQSIKEQVITILPGPDFTFTKNPTTPVSITYTNTTQAGIFTSFVLYDGTNTPMPPLTVTKTYRGNGTISVKLTAQKDGATRTVIHDVDISDPSLKGFFPLDGLNGPSLDVVKDVMGNMGGTAATTNPLPGTAGNLELAFNRFFFQNAAVYFDGVNDKFTMGPLQNIYNINHNISVSMWVKFAVLDHSSILLFCNNAAGNFYTPILYYSAADSTINGGFPTSLAPMKSTMKISSTGNWYHVVMTADANGNHKLYVNGTLQAQRDNTPVDFLDMSETQVGYGGLNGWPGNVNTSNYFNGSLDEIRIYNKVLTATEVQALYN